MAKFDLQAVITAKDEASKVIKGVSGETSKLGNVLSSGLKYAAVGAAAGIAALGATALSSAKSFMESEAAGAQMEAVLKSTGHAAGLFKEDLQDQANALQNVTKYSDEAVMGMQSVLLTFTNIKGGAFQQATDVILDMSTALGQDLQSSAIQVGKALQDPILGVTALRRVGVNFNEQQQEQIKKMVEAGEAAKAQQYILAELRTEFGGSATAAGQTFGGQMTILSNKLDNVKERFGEAIIKGITPFVSKLSAFMDSPAGQKFADDMTASITRFFNYINDHQAQIMNFLNALGQVLGFIGNTVKFVANMFNEVAKAIANAIVKVEMFVEKAKNFNIIDSVKNKASSIFGGFKAEGGSVSAGTPYIVGEQGAELFVPKTSGTIIPNDRLAGGTVINISFSGNISVGSGGEGDLQAVLGRSVRQALQGI